MKRRSLLATLSVAASARTLPAAEDIRAARAGICSFSCHLRWQAVHAGQAGVEFTDAPGFLRYGRSLGAEGVQTGIGALDAGAVRKLRESVEAGGGYFEGELQLPRTESDVAAFDVEVQRTRETGATVARSFMLGTRRYETFKTFDEFRAFQKETRQRLRLAEPVLRRHKLKLALENHKDHTAEELIALLRLTGSEWIGALVDTGNNIALCEEPHEVVEALAPFAFSVHFKDMAVQPAPDGFLLSEVPLGTGCLDLPRIVLALRRANRGIVFNLEMATRDPLRIPCKIAAYWATFPGRRESAERAALAFVDAHPLRQPPPAIAGKPQSKQLALEEQNNRACLSWMRDHLNEA